MRYKKTTEKGNKWGIRIAGYVPEQMMTLNHHRIEGRAIRATGLSFFGKFQLVVAIIMSIGLVLVGTSMIWCLIRGVTS